MIKRLTRKGNRVALVLDKKLLEAAGLKPDDKVEVSSNGRVIVIAPVRTESEVDRFERARVKLHARFAGRSRGSRSEVTRLAGRSIPRLRSRGPRPTGPRA